METFPALLPAFRADYSYSVEGRGIARTDMASGAVRQRRRVISNDDVASVTLRLTDIQLRMFETFVKIKLHNGADWFNGYHWDGNRKNARVIRLQGGAYEVGNVAPGLWDASMVLDIRDRTLADDYIALWLQGFSVIDALNIDWCALFAQLAITVNDNALKSHGFDAASEELYSIYGQLAITVNANTLGTG